MNLAIVVAGVLVVVVLVLLIILVMSNIKLSKLSRELKDLDAKNTSLSDQNEELSSKVKTQLEVEVPVESSMTVETISQTQDLSVPEEDRYDFSSILEEIEEESHEEVVPIEQPMDLQMDELPVEEPMVELDMGDETQDLSSNIMQTEMLAEQILTVKQDLIDKIAEYRVRIDAIKLIEDTNERQIAKDRIREELVEIKRQTLEYRELEAEIVETLIENKKQQVAKEF